MRVAMQGGEQHIGAIVENVLRAIAMVEVYVQHSHAFGALAQAALGSDGSVVEVAVAAHVFAGRMVPRRAAQGEGTVGAIDDALHAGQGNVSAAAHGFPGTSGDRCAGVHGIEAQLAVDEAGFPVDGQVAHRPHQRQRIVGLAGGGPFRPGVFQEAHVALAVRRHVAGAVEGLFGNHIAQAGAVHPGQHGVGTPGVFERGRHCAVLEFRAVVQAVVVAKDCQHANVLFQGVTG
ncbi:hypothetical protein D3C77_521660 [compost metagenome]